MAYRLGQIKYIKHGPGKTCDNNDRFVCAALGKPFTSICSWRKAMGNHLYSSALPKSTMARQKWQCHHGPVLGQSTHYHQFESTIRADKLTNTIVRDGYI